MRAASQAVANRSTSRKRKPPVSTEQLAAESNTRVEPPDGAPRLRFLFELSRRERAAYMRALDKVSSGIKTAETGEVLEGVAESDDPQALVQRRLAESPSILKVTADLAEAAADVEDLLLTVAEDPAEYAAWAKSAPDESLMQLFGWYMQEAEAGEAPASPI